MVQYTKQQRKGSSWPSVVTLFKHIYSLSTSNIDDFLGHYYNVLSTDNKA